MTSPVRNEPGEMEKTSMAVTVTGAVLSETGGTEAQPVTFGYRGVVYRVVLDERDRTALDEIFARYIPLAEPVGECAIENGTTA